MRPAECDCHIACCHLQMCVLPPPAPIAPPPPSVPILPVLKVVVTLTASGSLSDYADTSALRQEIAEAAGVPVSLVEITVVAASVIITATIAVPASTSADAVQSTLSTKLSSAAAASEVLGIAVEAVPVVTISGLAPSPPPASPSTERRISMTFIIVGVSAVGGVILVLVIIAACIARKNKRKKTGPSPEILPEKARV